MKSILLTTTALVAFAGAAAAEGHTSIGFSGTSTLGYNDEANTAAGADDYNGFYFDTTLTVKGAAELDNGVTASAQFNIDIQEDGLGEANSVADGNTNLSADDFVMSLSTESATLTFGDTATAAGKMWKSAGDMESDGFTTDAFDAIEADAVLRGDVTMGDVSASVSYVIVTTGTQQEIDQLSFGVNAAVAGVNIAAAYEEATTKQTEAGDANNDEIFGLSVGFAAVGANFTVAYAEDENSQSTGVKASMPVGPVTVTGYYVDENAGNGDANFGVNVKYAADALTVALDLQDDQGTSKIGIDGSYDLGNGLTIMAGALDNEVEGTDTYVAAGYDLGGGAALLVSYADAETTDALADDEVGGPDYQVGTTLAVSFKF
jgi:outer membrane protein OmpU